MSSRLFSGARGNDEPLDAIEIPAALLIGVRLCARRQRFEKTVAAAARMTRDAPRISFPSAGQYRLHARLEYVVVQAGLDTRHGSRADPRRQCPPLRIAPATSSAFPHRANGCPQPLQPADWSGEGSSAVLREPRCAERARNSGAPVRRVYAVAPGDSGSRKLLPPPREWHATQRAFPLRALASIGRTRVLKTSKSRFDSAAAEAACCACTGGHGARRSDRTISAAFDV